MTCTGSKKVMGGGVVYFTNNTCSTPFFSIATSSRFVTHSGPASDSAWATGVVNNSANPIYLKLYAICVDAN